MVKAVSKKMSTGKTVLCVFGNYIETRLRRKTAGWFRLAVLQMENCRLHVRRLDWLCDKNALENMKIKIDAL